MKQLLRVLSGMSLVFFLASCSLNEPIGDFFKQLGSQDEKLTLDESEKTDDTTTETGNLLTQDTNKDTEDTKNINKNEDKKQVLKVMSVSDTILSEIEDFERLTQCEVEVEVVDVNGFTQMLLGEIQNNARIPDVIVFESSDLHNESINQYLLDLSELDTLNDLVDNQYPSVYEYGFDMNRKLLGVSYHMNPVGLFYRRSMAKEVFGTDDPNYIQEYFRNYESIGQMMSKLSNRNIKFLPDLFAFRYFSNLISKSWVDEDGFYRVNTAKIDFLETIKQLKAEQAVAFATEWSDEWISGMYGNINNDFGKDMQIFAYVLPSWGLQHVMMLASPETNKAATLEETISDQDNNDVLGRNEIVLDYNPTSGDWAVAAINHAGFLGGDYLSIYKNSPNLELASQFISYMVADEQHLKVWSTGSHQLFSNQKITNIQPFSEENSFLGGQEFEVVFKNIALNYNRGLLENSFSEEEHKELLIKEIAINSMFEGLSMEFIEGEFHTVNEAMIVFEQRVKQVYPELFEELEK